MRIRIEQSENDGQWYVKYRGNNNETMASSEGYPTDDGAARAVVDFYESLLSDIGLETGTVITVPITFVNSGGTEVDGGVTLARPS